MQNANQLCYAKYSCEEKFPLGCRNSRNSKNKACHVCGFPTALALPARLKTGQAGAGREVEVKELLGVRGNGLLYRGTRLGDRQPAILKEYVLPARYFTPARAQARRENFRRFATVAIADGRPPEFRLLVPEEIYIQASDPTDRDSPTLGRCYHIMAGERLAYPSLRDYLALNGKLSPERVRWLLAQVLQSLICLHGQKFRFPAGEVRRGLEHGNLTLDALLLDSLVAPTLVYLSDLALWEHLFAPQASWEEGIVPDSQGISPAPLSARKDLADLGVVAIALLRGQESPDPLAEKDARLSSRPQLDDFIYALLGVGAQSTFESAEVAAARLQDLAWEKVTIAAPTDPTAPAAAQAPASPIVPAVAALVAVLLLGGGIGLWLRGKGKSAIAPEVCCFERVAPLPARALYLGDADGVWNYVFAQTDLVAPGQSLQAIVRAEQAALEQWCYLTYAASSGTTAAPFEPACLPYTVPEAEFAGKSLLAVAGAGTIDFAISHPGVAQFDAIYGVHPFAYDSLAVFVAFNYSRRTDGLTQRLNGTISFAQLRQLYTGQVDRWRQLDRRLPNIPVRLYAPQDETAIALFESRVLQDPESIAAFRRLLAAPADVVLATEPAIVRLPTPQLLRRTIADFEDGPSPIGSIGFDSLARIFNQCSVYPLALRRDSSPFTRAVAPLVTNDGTAVTPRTDLCRGKGNYRPNDRAIATQRYPLSYSLATVYRRDNRRPNSGESFARLLQTTQGQCLLQRASLTPLAPDTLTCDEDE